MVLEGDKKFTFSIIIAFYNSEQYLERTLNSLFEQVLCFEETVQLILVDDGSKDGSIAICNKYKQIFPNNIIILSQNHCGVSNARNYGLKYATGKYVNFLDSDDYLSKNTLYEIKKFFEINYNNVDVVAIPMFYFEREHGEDFLNYKFSESRVIDLEYEPNNPQISISSTFIKRNSIKEGFCTDLISSEDTLFLYNILL